MYRQYMKRNYIVQLNQRLSDINTAIQSYVNNTVTNPYRLLPCPADPTQPSTSVTFGKAVVDPAHPTDYPCPTAGGYGGTAGGPGGALAVVAGIKRTNAGARVYPFPNTPATNPYWPITQPPSWGWVRIGAVPVRNLGLDDNHIADPNGHLFIYAVSETQANLPPQRHIGDNSCGPTSNPINLTCFTFPASTPANPYMTLAPDQTQGAIDIQDPTAGFTSLVNPAGSALYVVIAPGKDGMGAYNLNGLQGIPCGGAGYDVKNCLGNNVIFYKAPYSEQ